MNDNRPKLIGVFPSQFPMWGGERTADRMYESPRGLLVAARFIPFGVSAIDVNGHLWVLVDDWGEKDTLNAKKWVRFNVEFVR